MSQYTFPTASGVIHADGTSVFALSNVDINGGTFKGDTDTSSVMAGSAHGQAEPEYFGSTVFSGTGITSATPEANLANQEAGNYIIKAVSGNLATVSSIVLASAAALHGDARSAVHERNAVRTQHVASAIRSGAWDIYAGAFSPVPGVANDQSVFVSSINPNAVSLTDNETLVGSTYGIPGEHAYRDGGPNPVSGSYDAKTA